MRIREVALIVGVGGAIYFAWIAPSLAAGLVGGPAWLEHYGKEPGFWFFSSGRSLADQAALVGKGFAEMAAGFPIFRPERSWSLAFLGTGALAAAATALAVKALWKGRLLGVLGALLAVQGAHGFLFNSDNPERWDMPVIVLGLMGSLAVTEMFRLERKTAARRLLLVFGTLSFLLAAMNVTAYARFVRSGERYFLEAARGGRPVQDVTIDCIGAHWRLCRAARDFARVVKPSAGFGEVLAPAWMGSYLVHATVNWFGAYMSQYEPGYPNRKGTPVYSISVFESSLPLFGLELEAGEGFMFLVLDKREARERLK